MQALRNEPITIFGDGLQTRSFCYISDLVDGINSLLMSDYSKPVNIGNPDEITIIDLAKEIIEHTNSSSKIQFEDLPTDDPKKRQPDIQLANKVLDWHPKIDRKEGILASYDYFKNQLDIL